MHFYFPQNFNVHIGIIQPVQFSLDMISSVQFARPACLDLFSLDQIAQPRCSCQHCLNSSLIWTCSVQNINLCLDTESEHLTLVFFIRLVRNWIGLKKQVLLSTLFFSNPVKNSGWFRLRPETTVRNFSFSGFYNLTSQIILFWTLRGSTLRLYNSRNSRDL